MKNNRETEVEGNKEVRGVNKRNFQGLDSPLQEKKKKTANKNSY